MPFAEALQFIDIQFPHGLTFEKEEKALEFCLQTLKQNVGSVSEFRDYVLRPRVRRHQDRIKANQDAVDRYETFRIAREKVACLAKLNQIELDTRRGMTQLLRFLDIQIDEQGIIHPRDDWFIKSVTEVEATRIRECQVCDRIFWAGKIGLQGCSSRCLDILRKRNKRKRDAAKRLEGDQQRAAGSPLSDTEKRDLVRQTLRSGELDQSQIAKESKLSADEVADVLTYLILESGEVYSEQNDETRVYFLKEESTEISKLRA
jgi:predicted nucleic acid-binding Zn ribbon protein